MKVVNPLFRKQNNAETAAHACNCICAGGDDAHNSAHNDAWWIWGSTCGCACNGTKANKDANTDTATNM